MKNLENRAVKDSKTLVQFGKAQAILGDTVKAEKYIDNALRISPDLTEAKTLQAQYNTPQVQIEKIITEVEKNPANPAIKKELENRVTNFVLPPGSNASVRTTAAKAHALLGDTSRALSLADSALHKDVKNTEAVDLKNGYSKKRIPNRRY